MKINNKLINKYSTNEEKIGTWINGKPLYRKVIVYDNSSGSTAFQIEISTENGSYYDYMCISEKSIVALGSNSTIRWQPLNMISGNTTSAYYVRTNIQYDGYHWFAYVSASASSYVQGTIYLAVEYTKTTD